MMLVTSRRHCRSYSPPRLLAVEDNPMTTHHRVQHVADFTVATVWLIGGILFVLVSMYFPA